MVNFYKQFESFKKQKKLSSNDKITLLKFKQELMVFFGFGGRNRTIDRWIKNFKMAGLIDIKRNDVGEWIVTII